MLKIAAFALLGAVSFAQTVRIEFEHYPGPDGVLGTVDDVVITAPTTFASQTLQLTDEFATLGIRFVPNPPLNGANEVLNGSTFTTPAGHTPPNLLAGETLNVIRADFTVPVSRVSALIGISGGSDLLEIFDAGGASLGSLVGDDVVVSISSATNIASFEIRTFSGTTPAIDNLEFDIGGTPPPTVYCTSSTTTNGCSPSISATDQPSVSFATTCDIAVSSVEGQKAGLIFYGISGPNAVSWGVGSTSFFCVKTPTIRTPSQNSGGTNGQCDGALFLDWNAFQQATPGALGQPWSAGNKAYVQGWFRDPPAPRTTNLSNAVELTHLP
jgi:hypothetical protein